MKIFFEKDNLFETFQFGFRNKKSTILEMLTLFDNLLEEKEKKKEISFTLYDLVLLLTLYAIKFYSLS